MPSISYPNTQIFQCPLHFHFTLILFMFISNEDETKHETDHETQDGDETDHEDETEISQITLSLKI